MIHQWYSDFSTMFKFLQELVMRSKNNNLSLMCMFLLCMSSLQAADYKPAIEFSSLLHLPFYSESGGFRLDGLQIIFPPEGKEKIGFVITDEANNVVVSNKLRIEDWDRGSFKGLRPEGSGIVSLDKPGKYTMAFFYGKEFYTVMRFSLQVEDSGDEFDPKKNYTLDGLWSELSYFSMPAKKKDAPLAFTWWSSLREVSGAESAKCSVHLMKGDDEIASSRAVFVSSKNWTSYTVELKTPKSEGDEFLTMAMLTSKEGEYDMVIKMDGETVKSYGLQVESGDVTRPNTTKLGYEPSYSFISPRKIDTSRKGNYRQLELVWMYKNTK